MYHPTRGGVRGGRDQFNWDDVKVDKHRENYLGHSIKAPVGRWQKGKDLHWYTRDKSSSDMDLIKEEIKLIKEKEEEAMREALGLAPQRRRSYGNRLDKREFSELVQRGSTAEDLEEGHAEATRVQGVGFLRVGAGDEEARRFSEERVQAQAVHSAGVEAPIAKESKKKRHHHRDSDSKTSHTRRRHDE